MVKFEISEHMNRPCGSFGGKRHDARQEVSTITSFVDHLMVTN